MFTGIVEEVGALRSLRVGESTATLDVVARGVLDGTAVGDSILTDGVCLTITALRRDGFTADAMPETVRRTTLTSLRRGDPVNLERALRLTDRLGGHIVNGHVVEVGGEIDPAGIAVHVARKAAQRRRGQGGAAAGRG